jgi:hypothetical protein
MQKNAVKIFQASIIEVEIGIFGAEGRGGPDEGFYRIENTLNILDSIGPESFDKVIGVGSRHLFV